MLMMYVMKRHLIDLINVFIPIAKSIFNVSPHFYFTVQDKEAKQFQGLSHYCGRTWQKRKFIF
jgi:hypothetical protein